MHRLNSEHSKMLLISIQCHRRGCKPLIQNATAVLLHAVVARPRAAARTPPPRHAPRAATRTRPPPLRAARRSTQQPEAQNTQKPRKKSTTLPCPLASRLASIGNAIRMSSRGQEAVIPGQGDADDGAGGTKAAAHFVFVPLNERGHLILAVDTALLLATHGALCTIVGPTSTTLKVRQTVESAPAVRAVGPARRLPPRLRRGRLAGRGGRRGVH
ncbi:UDP-glycosyltransferase 73C5-like [Panicum miliaceum]|uniref:UDP-glycosyltransferase 73C5-like n=1 Tax=Panicum miliaceum TaxID=4540 RepID=A0A3L6Q0S7_PANMI|nr:UDP-glycosyltransferase 73C5-like [Panicum miliaceum]